MVVYTQADITDASEEYICHACNCISVKPESTMAKKLHGKWPEADPYTKRKPLSEENTKAVIPDRPAPGTIEVLPTNDGKKIICMYTQYSSDKPYFDSNVPDSVSYRNKWFQNCLEAIGKLEPKPTQIAIYHMIGCGPHGGGNWWAFINMIEYTIERKYGIPVVVYEKGLNARHSQT